ncbi:MAG: cob(I)yrinic acid a,c-diamide adenosyltransferase [Bacteroidales bacterium]
MHIYTKTGDTGQTSLIGGRRVPKYDIRIEAYGTVDELISYIGLIRDQQITRNLKDELLTIQDRLMVCASILAADSKDCDVELPIIRQEDITTLEDLIDNMEKELPELNSFVLPGGHPTVSFVHIARNVCRRAERNAIRLYEDDKFPEIVIQYLNRLSDYLFMLARLLLQKLNGEEIIWKPLQK